MQCSIERHAALEHVAHLPGRSERIGSDLRTSLSWNETKDVIDHYNLGAGEEQIETSAPSGLLRLRIKVSLAIKVLRRLVSATWKPEVL